MISYIKNLFRKNKRRLIIASGVISLIYLSTKFLQKKLNEFQDRIREENFTKEQIKRRFHQTQKDCYMTFISLVAVLNEPILSALPAEKIFKELQMIRLERQLTNNESKIGASTIVSEDFPSESGNEKVNTNDIVSNKKSKAELWSDLKITTVARFLSVIYAQSLLVVVIHIQLNVLSRKLYLASAIDLASKTQGIKLYEDEEELKLDQDDTEGEKRFLSITYYLISKGYQKIVDDVMASVQSKFDDINVRYELSIEEFIQLIISTTNELELPYIDLLGLTEEYSEDEDDLKDDKKFEILKQELKNNIESQETRLLLHDLVIANIKHVQDIIQDKTTTDKVKLATLLIQLAKNIPNFNPDLQLQIVPGVGDLSASVYSNF